MMKRQHWFAQWLSAEEAININIYTSDHPDFQCIFTKKIGSPKHDPNNESLSLKTSQLHRDVCDPGVQKNMYALLNWSG